MAYHCFKRKCHIPKRALILPNIFSKTRDVSNAHFMPRGIPPPRSFQNTIRQSPHPPFYIHYIKKNFYPLFRCFTTMFSSDFSRQSKSRIIIRWDKRKPYCVVPPKRFSGFNRASLVFGVFCPGGEGNFFSLDKFFTGN